MTTRADLQAALQSANVAAFLHVIRAGESNQGDSAYSLLNGGASFSGFADHPFAGQPAPPGLAAGAYQFIPHTWQHLVERYGFPDFSPASQDEGAVGLIVGRGALEDVMAGNLAAALQKLREEWVSLASMPFTKAQAIIEQYGGTVAGMTQPQSEPATAPPPGQEGPSQPSPQPEAPMGAALALQVLPMILSMIPALGGIKPLAALAAAPPGSIPALPAPTAGGGSMHAGDYIALAQTILETFVKAIPAANGNPMIAVGMAQDDPALKAQAAQAVLTHPDVAAQLTAMVPVFDRLHQYDQDAWAAARAGRESAAAVAQHDTFDVAPAMVSNVNNTTWVVLAGLGVGFVLAILAKAVFPELPDYAAMIIPTFALVVGQLLKERGAIIAYRFDGTPASNATAAVNAQLAQINAPPKP